MSRFKRHKRVEEKEESKKFRRRKKRKKTEGECRMCSHWSEIPGEYLLKDGRLCPWNKREKMTSDSHACDEFILANWIHCKSKNFMTAPIICKNRMNKAISEGGCAKSCKDGKVISKLFDSAL